MMTSQSRRLRLTGRRPYASWGYGSVNPFDLGGLKCEIVQDENPSNLMSAPAIETTLKTATQALATATLTLLWNGRRREQKPAFSVWQLAII